MKALRYIAAVLAVALACAGTAAASTLNAGQRQELTAYVGALQHRHYDDAFRSLAPSERTYFRSASNFASIFTADDLRIQSFRIIGARDAGALGAVGLVSEHISFLDHAHQTHGTATVTVPYGIVRSGARYRIKDPFHPWRAFRADSTATVNGLRVTVRKVSFFTDRVELLMTFANLGDGFATILPYGRSVLKDGSGAIYRPIATRLSALTDKRLYLGLRLASSAQYTGALNFAAPAAHLGRSLELRLGPALRDGADEPFAVVVSPIAVPATAPGTRSG